MRDVYAVKSDFFSYICKVTEKIGFVMKQSYFIMSLLLTAACLLTSCVRDVVLDAGESPQVVVDCILSNEDVQELHLIFTKGASVASLSSGGPGPWL